MKNIKHSKEYQEIARFYSDGQQWKVASRSKVPLIDHIDEGIDILDKIGASEAAKLAFCLHPLVQNNEDVDVSYSTQYGLACEYRDRANAYLCRPTTDYIQTVEQIKEVVGSMSKDCRDMLVADKTHNQKHFNDYHKGHHARSVELERYFKLWLEYLNNEQCWKSDNVPN